jgi:hypothetical protein
MHILGLTSFVELVLFQVINGKDVPNWKEGLLFTNTSRHTWLDIPKRITSVGRELNALGMEGGRGVSLDEGRARSVNGSR